MNHTSCRLVMGWIIVTLTLPVAAAPVGMEALHRLDLLPTYKSSVKVGMVSSYDRAGGNDDGFSGKYSYVRQEEGALVLAELEGPGVIYRVWTPTPTDDVLEFWFDGEARPRVSVKYRDLFLGKHPAFPRPLTGFGAGGYYCYVPMPFAKSCVVRIRAPKTQFYQINYALYAPGTALTTFNPEAAGEALAHRNKACELFTAAGTDISRFAAPPGDRVETLAAKVTVPARGSARVFEARQGGRIVGLRLWPAAAFAGKERDLMLRVTFDDGPPSVWCPVGDFFGYAWGQPAMRGLLAGTTGATNYCYAPMPYKSGARVEIVSERGTPVEVQAEVLHTATPRRADEGGFCAVWRRENPTKIGQPFTFVDTRGRGHLVGVMLQSQGFESGKTLFFEGDDQTTIDGERVIHGTGSEDFFNGGWYDVPDRWEKRISFPLSGCLDYLKHLGRTGAYRFFLGDAYPYRQSLLQTIEHAGEKNSIATDYVGVTWLYAETPLAEVASTPALKERAVRDLREVVFPAWWQLPLHAWSFDKASLTRKRERIGEEDVRFLSLSATGEDWFGAHFLSPVCEVPVAGRYAIYIEAVKGPAQGRVQLFQNENPIGEAVDLYAEQPAKSGRLLLGKLDLAEGRNALMLKLTGKHEKSAGLGLDLVEIICAREP